MENSKIEWCEHTFNPWIGCTKISPACDHCYAADLSARTFKVKWGAGEARKRTSAENWKQPGKWDAEAKRAQNYYEHVSIASSGASQGEQKRPRVFCASLADVFDNEVPDEWRADLFDLIRKTPCLDWMILTKRIGNWHSLVTKAHQFVMKRISNEGRFNERDKERPIWDLGLWLQKWLAGNPPENVHLGITICNQAEADRDIPKLLATSAAKRFLSIEPMLGPIDLNLGWRNDTWREDSSGRPLPLRRIDLVIAGGESGPHARPSHPDWFRSLRDQCASAGVPFMFKQWGEFSDDINTGNYDPKTYKVKSVVFVEPDGRHGPIMLEADGHGYPIPKNHAWHWETAFGETLNPGAGFLQRVGKKAAGRLLDGVEHNGRIA